MFGWTRPYHGVDSPHYCQSCGRNSITWLCGIGFKPQLGVDKVSRNVMARVLKVCVPNTRFAIAVIIHEVDLHVTNNNRSAYW
jgi:hypothetical protein